MEFPDLTKDELGISPKLTIYTDGGARKGGIGGAAFACIADDGYPEYTWHGAFAPTTTNRMEVRAIVEALRWAGKKFPEHRVEIRTDSRYAMGIPKWSGGWAANGWVTGSGEPVKNLDLVIHYLNAAGDIADLQINHVKGHDGDPWNELVDTLNKIAMDEAQETDGFEWPDSEALTTIALLKSKHVKGTDIKAVMSTIVQQQEELAGS